MPAQDEVLFREVQWLRQWWIWALLIGSLAFAIAVTAIAVSQIGLGTMWRQSPAGTIIGLVLGPLILLGVVALMYYSKMVTEVRRDGIYIRYVPFHRSYRRVPFSEIQSYEARTYDPIGEYGGWGIRWGWQGGRRNMAYNVSGNQGVQLVLKDGKRLLIGSQKPEELGRAIEAGMAQTTGPK